MKKLVLCTCSKKHPNIAECILATEAELRDANARQHMLIQQLSKAERVLRTQHPEAWFMRGLGMMQ